MDVGIQQKSTHLVIMFEILGFKEQVPFGKTISDNKIYAIGRINSAYVSDILTTAEECFHKTFYVFEKN